MQDGQRMKLWARMAAVIGVLLLLVSMYRAPAAGFDLAINERGLAFELKSGFLSIAFEIGRQCSESNSFGRIL